MPAIDARDLKKAFGPQTILAGATLTIVRGEKVGLIGDNGSGKSTLARILSGLEPADEGTVAVRRGLSIGYLSQEPELDGERSAREVVEQGLSAWRAAVDRHAVLTTELGEHADDAKLAEQADLDETIARLGGWDRGHLALDLLQRLDVRDPDGLVGPRSGGEKRRIALARLLVSAPDVAILDEPTNHLDADTAAWLETYLADQFVGAVVLVTHDRYFLEAIVDRILELDRGVLTEYIGGYQDYLEQKGTRLAHEERVEQNRRNVLRREREWLSRGPKARSTKQKARIQRAHALEAETPANVGRGAEVVLDATVRRQGKTILVLEGVVLTQGGRRLTAPIDLHVHAGDRIGVLGPNGCGKTTLLRAVLGERGPVTAGAIVVGKNSKIGYLDQARAGLDDDKSIFDDVRGVGATSVVLGGETLDLRAYLERFLFSPDKQRQKVGALSGGERARVALAKMLREEANLLLFDEPTNDLDLSTLSALEDLLVGYGGSVLVVTHDRAFLDRVATSVLVFDVVDGVAGVEQHGGGYSDFVAHREELRSAERAASAPKASKAEARASERPEGKRLTYAERLELDGILARIEAAEGEVGRLEAALADPELYSARGHEVPERSAALAAAREGVARLLSRWEELESRRDEMR